MSVTILKAHNHKLLERDINTILQGSAGEPREIKFMVYDIYVYAVLIW